MKKWLSNTLKLVMYFCVYITLANTTQPVTIFKKKKTFYCVYFEVTVSGRSVGPTEWWMVLGGRVWGTTFFCQWSCDSVQLSLV